MNKVAGVVYVADIEMNNRILSPQALCAQKVQIYILFRKLADLLTEKQSALEKNDAIVQRLQLMEKENKDIRLSLQEQHKVLMEKKAQIVDIESRLSLLN